MGISDRDYMRRRPPDDEGPGGRSRDTASRLARLLGRFFDRYPRFGFWLAVGLGALALAALILARVSRP